MSLLGSPGLTRTFDARQRTQDSDKGQEKRSAREEAAIR